MLRRKIELVENERLIGRRAAGANGSSTLIVEGGLCRSPSSNCEAGSPESRSQPILLNHEIRRFGPARLNVTFRRAHHSLFSPLGQQVIVRKRLY